MASSCDAQQQEGRLKAKVTSLLAPWWSCLSEVWKLQKIIRFILKKNNTKKGKKIGNLFQYLNKKQLLNTRRVLMLTDVTKLK